jgi:photosystem II stability/assembly factor-like uncharacterized protein
MTKPDILDQKIRLLVAELVDSAPLAPPLPDRDTQVRWHHRRRRRLALRSLTAAVAFAGLVVAVSLVLAGGVAPSPNWALAGEISSSWVQVPGRGLTSGFSLTCPSTTTCYAETPISVEGSVEVSRDGGKTWQPAPTNGGTSLSNVACSSAAECAFLAVGASGKPVFFETADGGKTWTPHPGPAMLSAAHSVTKDPSGTRSAIGPVELSCPVASICTAVVGDPNLVAGFETEDGGRTWSAFSYMPITPLELQCFRDARCISTGGGGASYSTDNGLEWSNVSELDATTVELLSCSSPRACMAVSSPPFGGQGTALFASRNEGESWSTVEAQGLPAGEAFLGLACPTASECWMSGNVPVHLRDGTTVLGTAGTTVLSSTNGGLTWQSTALPKGITGIASLSCPNPSTCFAVAVKGPRASSSGPPKRRPSLELLVHTEPRS